MTLDEKVLDEFYNIITESKQEMFDQIASERTRYLTVVLESIQKEHNASAVLRTCDCFGIQDLHAIEKSEWKKNEKYEVQRDIALGAGKWVDLIPHTEGEQPTTKCLKELKQKGYRIVATTPHTDRDINDIKVNQPIALVFGTEVNGISNEVINEADELVRIPMYGFTESFNISVSAAIALNILRNKLENTQIDWKLSEKEQTKLKIKWSSRIIRDGDKVESEIRRRAFEKR